MDSRTGERGAAFKMASLLKFALNQEGLDLKTFSIPTSPTLGVPGHQGKLTVDQVAMKAKGSLYVKRMFL